ncbi:LysM peptidoglycan-binding domain-containing protein [Microbacterium hominis]|uniref:LysM peptidoglycan-binding domain-containing protein n=1 Tax=Microbacterium hominis TaxID=162426 RepID=A0A7D4U2K6_9MICO|nr:LysM peptidoglycan-binding domain-containing protein [Microbacterium hominis]QKJ18045.1 LysM peptidoglycan-binding domain-containing protein [Microbacterium hominis]
MEQTIAMPPAGKSATTLPVLVIAIAALAGCTASPTAQEATPATAASTALDNVETDEVECPANHARINLGGNSASVTGDLVDTGEREFAAGAVGKDDSGRVVTYTVATGDAVFAIAERFCIDNPGAITELNHTRTIQPDEVLLLSPDSSIPWVPYFNPAGAPAGYQQIPYQLAIEAMSTAAAAGDIDSLRSIFANELSALFPNPADADEIQRALDAGDLDVLRQMFA